jgi:hypothetical protein
MNVHVCAFSVVIPVRGAVAHFPKYARIRVVTTGIAKGPLIVSTVPDVGPIVSERSRTIGLAAFAAIADWFVAVIPVAFDDEFRK